MKDDPKMLASDARHDQGIAAITEAARDDIEDWCAFGRKINRAADTRVKCGTTAWTPEEIYRLVRLAHVAHGIVTGRLLNRDV